MASSHTSVPFFKSSSRAIGRILFVSREKHRDKNQKLRQQLENLERHHQRVVNEKRELEQLCERQERELRRLRRENARLASEPTRLPADPKLDGHRFGARMIAMCCNLAKTVGFRSTETVLSIVRDWLEVEIKIPSWSGIRTWLCRSGVAALLEAAVPQDDWILMVDHSVQLGDTNVLVVLGIRQCEVPVGRALRHEDMKTLAVIPSKSRTKESVADALNALAGQIGTPICVLADGATELHEGAKVLQNNVENVLVLDDMKHKAANILKKTLGKELSFLEFESLIGKTTASIQQTELVHFLPPKKKTKCRFMNLVPLLNWAAMVIYHLQTPSAPGNDGVSADRLNEKLGWVLQYQEDLKSWQACQNIVSAFLVFTNEQGVYQGATDQLREHLAGLEVSLDALCEQVRDQLVEAFSKCEQRLVNSPHASLRFPVSTEVLESTLGRFKQIQRQHNRGSFTSLLAAFSALLNPSTPETIARHLTTVNNRDVRNWVTKANLDNSTQAKKNKAYRATKKRNLDRNTLLLEAKI